MEIVEDFLNNYKNLDKMSKEEIIDLVKKDRLEHLDSYKDYKKGKILNNANNRSIDILKGMLEYTYNNYKNNQALEVLDNVKLVAILFCIYADTIIIYNILFNRLSNLEIIDNANLNNKPRKEILEMLEKIQNINNIETIKSIFNDNGIPQNFKNELLNYSTFLQANKLKTLQKENFKNEELEKFYNNIWKLSNVEVSDFKDNFKLYSVREKFYRGDKEKSKFGIAIKKDLDINNLQFSLLERKLLILMNWIYIFTNGLLDNYFLSAVNLNLLLFKSDNITLSTINAKKLNEAIGRLTQKYIYWELQNSKISKKIKDKKVITGFSSLCNIQVIYNSKIHANNNEGISKEIKGIIFNFNNFIKMRLQLKQIYKMPIELLQDTDYSLILVEYIIREKNIRPDKKISINNLLKSIYVYQKDLSLYEDSLYSVIMKDNKNTQKRFNKFMETLEYVLELISNIDLSNAKIINNNGEIINSASIIPFKEIRVNHIFIEFDNKTDEEEL